MLVLGWNLEHSLEYFFCTQNYKIILAIHCEDVIYDVTTDVNIGSSTSSWYESYHDQKTLWPIGKGFGLRQSSAESRSRFPPDHGVPGHIWKLPSRFPFFRKVVLGSWVPVPTELWSEDTFSSYLTFDQSFRKIYTAYNNICLLWAKVFGNR